MRFFVGVAVAGVVVGGGIGWRLGLVEGTRQGYLLRFCPRCLGREFFA